jgi:glycosyltransferase involved in cell wall biosynthesis
LNVCLVTYEFPPHIFGGAGTYAGNLFDGLTNEGINVHVLTNDTYDRHKKNVTTINTPDIAYWRRLFFSYYNKKVIEKLNERHGFDVIHYNEPHIILNTPKIPAISTFHSTQINELVTKISLSKLIDSGNLVETFIKSPVGGLADIISARKLKRIISPSTDLKKKISKYCLYDDNRIDVIPNGVKIPEIEKKVTINKHNLEKKKYILFIGRMDPIKGIEYLITAFNDICREYSDVFLVLVGDGYYKNYLKRITKTNKQIIFLGHISDETEKHFLYQNCEMLVLPSIYEAMPMVILEAMSYAKPVIASEVGGIPSIITDGINGFLTQPRDAYRIRKQIKKLLDQPDVSHGMGIKNRELIINQYSEDKMTKETINVYDKIVD